MESKVFTAEQDDKLIDLVRENPVIFDLSQKNYKDVLVKRNAWKKIATELGKDVEECRTRWKTIRDTYRRNMNRLKKKAKTGSPAFPKSKYMNKNLNFLEKCMKKRKVISNLSSPNCTTVKAVNTSNHREHLATNASRYEENPVTDASILQEDPVMNEEVFTEDMMRRDLDNEDDANEILKAENVKKGVNKAKKKSTREKMIDEIKAARAERSKILNGFLANQNLQKEYPVDLFFQSMAEVVKQFPPHFIAEARLKVCQVVNEIEYKVLQQHSPKNVITVDTRAVTPNFRVHTISSGDSANVLSPSTS